MFVITSETQKSELLQFLSQSAPSLGVLEIVVEELPNFLNSPVSFTIFSYQISNYPRPFLWKTAHVDIYNFFQSCDVQTQLIHNNADIKEADYNEEVSYIQSNYQHSSRMDDFANAKNISNLENNTSEGSDIKNQNILYIKKSNIIEANKDYQQKSPDSEKNIIIASPFTKTFDFYDEIPEINTEEDFYVLESATPETITSQNLLTSLDYQPSLLIQPQLVTKNTQTNNPNKLDQKNTQPYDSSNLDTFLSRVEKTQYALKEMRSREKKRVLSNNQLSNVRKKFAFALPVSFYVAVTSFVLVGFLFGAFLLFPTQAYTIEVNSQQKESSIDLTFKKDEFNKRQATFTVSTEGRSSGTTTVQTDRSKGRVKLVSSGRSCSITNGSFYLLNNGRYYRQVQDNNLPSTITIPENSSQTLNGVEVDVVAEQSGSEYNINQGSQFSITNLRKGNVGTSCFAIALSEIKNTELSGDRVFTQEDSQNLTTSANSQLALKRLQEISNLIQDKAYLDDQGDWFKNLEEQESFSSKIGDKTEKITLTKTVTTEMYYLTQSIFASKIKQQNIKIKDVSDVVMNTVQGSIITNSSVKISIFYKYTENSAISSDEIQNLLKSGLTTDEIKKKYPAISQIEINESGVSIPGINPRLNIEIQQ